MNARVLPVLALASVHGCAGTGTYKPEYLGDAPYFYGKPLTDRVLLYVAPEDRNYVFVGRPKSIVGYAVTVTLPLGLYLPEVGKEALASFFAGGVDPVEDLSVARQDLAVQLRVEDFAYRFDLLTAYVVHVDMQLGVTLLDPDGRSSWSDTYRAEDFRVQVKCAATQPEDCVNKAAHVTLFDLMYRAGSGLRNYRYSQAQ